RCPFREEGQCPTSPHCLVVKVLWRHIAQCMDASCMVPHCASSRFVMGHYHKCKEPKCRLCGPVRAIISRERDEQRLLGRTGSSDDEDSSDDNDGSGGGGGDDERGGGKDDEDDDDL
ncbi:unnamed protein product, partial [Ectocarpus sp. 12 AP-2014]